MRKIKFRAWFKNENEMKEVAINNVYEGNGTYLHLSPLPFGDYKVIELMQYTGLKDKNGKEIHEGDIVEQLDEMTYTSMTGKVIFADGSYLIENAAGNDGRYLFGEVVHNLVIGNIYENPELLEGEQHE